MKPIKLYPMGLVAIMIFAFSQQAFGQLANFYSSTNYSNFINNMINVLVGSFCPIQFGNLLKSGKEPAETRINFSTHLNNQCL